MSELGGGRMALAAALRVHRLAALPVRSCLLLLPPCLSLAACLPAMMAFTLGIR